MNNEQKIKDAEAYLFVLKSSENYIKIRLLNIIAHDIKEQKKIVEELKNGKQ